MYVLRKRLAFIAHPRTASRAFKMAFRKLGAESHNHHKIDIGELKKVKHAGGIVACVVRNMFDILVSFFHATQPVPRPFSQEEFTKWLTGDGVNNSYTDKPLYHYGLPHSNFVIYYEDLQEGFNTLLRRLGEAPIKLEFIGSSDRRPYREYYTPEIRAWVEERWSKDFRLTGYKW